MAQLESTYDYGSANQERGITYGEDCLLALYESRKIIKEGREAALWFKSKGLIRPKTLDEIKEDLKAIKPVRARCGRPSGEHSEFFESDTLEAHGRYVAGEALSDICEDYGTSPDSLRQRFRVRGLDFKDPVCRKEEAEKAKRMMLAGKDVATIAIKMEVSKTSVRSWLKEYTNYGKLPSQKKIDLVLNLVNVDGYRLTEACNKIAHSPEVVKKAFSNLGMSYNNKKGKIESNNK